MIEWMLIIFTVAFIFRVGYFFGQIRGYKDRMNHEPVASFLDEEPSKDMWAKRPRKRKR